MSDDWTEVSHFQFLFRQKVRIHVIRKPAKQVSLPGLWTNYLPDHNSKTYHLSFYSLHKITCAETLQPPRERGMEMNTVTYNALRDECRQCSWCRGECKKDKPVLDTFTMEEICKLPFTMKKLISYRQERVISALIMTWMHFRYKDVKD